MSEQYINSEISNLVFDKSLKENLEFLQTDEGRKILQEEIDREFINSILSAALTKR